ncbi:MAG: hypothetical protein DPW11_00590 [bacterium]|nr:hypothetical protein [bacterium]RIK51060.1 MAG: hypothetical protein DCC61_03695 [Candidatus Microgenomates bacterium]
MDQRLRTMLSSIGSVELSILKKLSGLKKGEGAVIDLGGLYQDNRELIDQLIAGAGNGLELELAVSGRDDIRFIEALAKEGIVDCLFSYVESKAIVTLKNPRQLRITREWVELVKPNLIEYGTISFDTSRGDVYFFDKKAQLKPDRGMFKIIKLMMSNKSHSITTKEISEIMGNTGKSDHMGNSRDRTESEIATQVIADIRSALGWKGELAGFIELTANKKYRLLPFPPGK